MARWSAVEASGCAEVGCIGGLPTEGPVEVPSPVVAAGVVCAFGCPSLSFLTAWCLGLRLCSVPAGLRASGPRPAGGSSLPAGPLPPCGAGGLRPGGPSGPRGFAPGPSPASGGPSSGPPGSLLLPFAFLYLSLTRARARETPKWRGGGSHGSRNGPFWGPYWTVWQCHSSSVVERDRARYAKRDHECMMQHDATRMHDAMHDAPPTPDTWMPRHQVLPGWMHMCYTLRMMHATVHACCALLVLPVVLGAPKCSTNGSIMVPGWVPISTELWYSPDPSRRPLLDPISANVQLWFTYHVMESVVHPSYGACMGCSRYHYP